MLSYYIHIKQHKPKAFVDRAGISCIEVKKKQAYEQCMDSEHEIWRHLSYANLA
jgi:hypothetical protein